MTGDPEIDRAQSADRPGDHPIGDGPMVRHGYAQPVEVTTGLAIGLSRMPIDQFAAFTPRTVGPDLHLIFSYVSQRVEFEGTGKLVVTPNEAVLCPSWQVYRSHEFYAGDEVTVFVAFTRECADQMTIADDVAPPTAHIVAAPSNASLSAWSLAHMLARTPLGHRSDLEYTERTMHLVTGTVSAARHREMAQAPTRLGTLQCHQSLADAVREHLAVSFSEQTLPLPRLARDVGASPYHLARVFRSVTGHSIHRYRTNLRLRFVLAALADEVPLSDLANEAGFASASHLSDLFRRCFAMPPSQLRAQLRGDAPAAGGSWANSRTNPEAGWSRRS